MSETLECPNCGAAVDYDPGDDPVLRCSYCQTTVVIPADLRQPSRAGQAFTTESPVWPEELFDPGQIASIQEIGRLARQGNKIDAIKLYRQVFGVGLKEAKDGIDSLESGGTAVIYYNLQAAQDPAQVEAEINRLLGAGDKVEAVKYYREMYQQGLKDSKEAVDDFEKTGILRRPGEASMGRTTGELPAALLQANKMVAVVELVASGDRVGAIAAYQEAFGVSLEEARLAVDKISRGVTEDSLPVSVQTISISAPAKGAAAATAGVLGGVSCISLVILVAILLFTVIPVMAALASPGGPLEGVWNRINPFAYARVARSFGEQGSGPGLLDDPRGIAVLPSGDLFVVNYSDGRVQKFDPDGTYRMLWNIGAEQYVSSIASDRAGRVYLVYDGDIWIFDGESGQLTGKLADQIDEWFDAVAASADGSLVAAVNSEEIYRFASSGALISSLADSPGTQTGDPDGVEDIAVDGLGNIYLLTDGEQPLVVYSPQGRLLARFGSEGDEQGQLQAPSAIAVDGQGNIYVSDIKGIQVFSGDGRYVDRIEAEGYPYDLAFDQQGSLWAISSLPKVFQYKIAGR